MNDESYNASRKSLACISWTSEEWCSYQTDDSIKQSGDDSAQKREEQRVHEVPSSSYTTEEARRIEEYPPRSANKATDRVLEVELSCRARRRSPRRTTRGPAPFSTIQRPRLVVRPTGTAPGVEVHAPVLPESLCYLKISRTRRYVQHDERFSTVALFELL